MSLGVVMLLLLTKHYFNFKAWLHWFFEKAGVNHGLGEVSKWSFIMGWDGMTENQTQTVSDDESVGLGRDKCC